MAVYNKCITFTREKLIDHYLKRDSLPDLIYGIVRFLGIIVQNIYCVSSYLVLSWIVLFPISWFRSDLYSKLENYLYNSLLFIVSSWSLAAGATVVETGEDYKQLIENLEKYSKKDLANGHKILGDQVDVSKKAKLDLNSKIDSNNTGLAIDNNNDSKIARATGDENRSVTTSDKKISSVGIGIGSNLRLNLAQAKPRILFLCNHISTADVPLIMQSFSTMTKQSLLWVLDAQFKPTNFGLVCSSHGDFFIAKDSFTDGSLKEQVLKHPDRNILVLFPEGGFLRKRLEGSNRYAMKNNLPLTRYVTHPRFGAFKDLIDPSVNVTHIVDATLMYEDIKNPLSILDIALGSRKEPVLLNYKIYERSEIHPTEEWLRNIWLEKDKLVQQYYEDRDSVYKRFESSMRSVKLDWLKVLAVHLFYLLVCYLLIYRLFNATRVTMLKARDLYYSNI